MMHRLAWILAHPGASLERMVSRDIIGTIQDESLTFK